METLVPLIKKALKEQATKLCFRSFLNTQMWKGAKSVFLKHKVTQEELESLFQYFFEGETLNPGLRILGESFFGKKRAYSLAYKKDAESMEIYLFFGKGAKVRSGLEWLKREEIKAQGKENFFYDELETKTKETPKETRKMEKKMTQNLDGKNLDNMFSDDVFEEREQEKKTPKVSFESVVTSNFMEEEKTSEFFSEASSSEFENSPAPALKKEAPLASFQQTAPVSTSTSTSTSTSHKVVINYANDLDAFGLEGNKAEAINKILTDMVSKGASDLHLTVGQPLIFRIDGEIQRQASSNLTSQNMETFFEPIIPRMKRQEFQNTWDIDFAHEIKKVGRFRVNLYRDRNGVASVIRHIPNEIISAQTLGLPKALLDFCRSPKGLILVTGPTGSGKSTTMAAMLDFINESRAEHILTIEDPIEFVYEQKKCLVNQREVSKHTNSFHAALKASLREDPDIILIGELRDLETTSHAVELAETGHLVFGTLHTNTAIATIDRIVDMYPPEQHSSIRNVLAANMRGIASQMLCKKIGGGRCAALEVLVMDEAISSLIRENKIHMVENHLKTQREAGNSVMADALLDLVEKKLITYEEAWNKAINKKSFDAQAERRNIKKEK